MPALDDRDWTHPEPSTSDATQTLPAFAGVYRIEASGEEGIPYPTLIAATTEPPMDPEAEVRGPRGCLAMADGERAAWVLTSIGRDRIELEARGAELRSCA